MSDNETVPDKDESQSEKQLEAAGDEEPKVSWFENLKEGYFITIFFRVVRKLESVQKILLEERHEKTQGTARCI